MFQIFQFIYRNRAFFLFITLEIIAFWLIFQFNNFHSTSYFHSANRISGSVYEKIEGINGYFSLDEVNQQLVTENAILRKKLNEKEIELYISSKEKNVIESDFEVRVAKVINISMYNADNFITINKGSADGITPGMSVIGSEGIVGVVKSVSEHFSLIYSILHSKLMISCRLKSTGDLASLKWDGSSYQFSKLEFLPKHVNVSIGDTVVTSGFNAIFPENMPVGVIEDIQSTPENLFYDLKLKLATDFSRLSTVYVIEDFGQIEVDSLQNNLFINE